MGQINASGKISMGGATVGESINLAIGFTATQQLSLNQNNVRALVATNVTAFPNDVIMGSSFYAMNAPTVAGICAFGSAAVGFNATPTGVSNLISTSGTVGNDVAAVGGG